MAGKVVKFRERNKEGGWDDGKIVKWRAKWLTSGKETTKHVRKNGKMVKWRAKWLTSRKETKKEVGKMVTW